MKNHIYRWVDRKIVGLADSMGVTIARSKPLDCRGQDIHPLEAYYRAGRFQPVLMDVPMSKLRGMGSAAFPCTQDSGHPFIETLMDYESGKVRIYAGSALERFYQHWQPKNAAEYLGIEDEPGCLRLREMEAIEAVLPWSRHDPKVQRENINNAVKLASKSQHGQIVENENRWHLFGPANKQSGEQEYRRLISAYTSIRDNGYQRQNWSDGDIRGTLILKDGDWCFFISGGQHRSSVLSTLGYTTAVVRIFYFLPMMVRREEYGYWPHVVDGLFSKEAALSIFDRIFEGSPPWQ